MEKQAIDFNVVVRGIVTYAASSETIERATQSRFEARKIVADFVRTAHGMEWKKVSEQVKAAIDSLTVGIVSDKNGLLGVIKTCVEYGIMPTTLNADRLRKAKTWTDLNGKVIPNGYGKVHTKEGAGQKAAPQTVPAPLNALALATMQPGANATTATTPASKAPTKPVTPQKAETAIHPITSNVSSSEEPISSQEHFTTLWMQISKNDAFKLEFVDMMAAALDVSRATLTNIMWQSAEQIIRGAK